MGIDWLGPQDVPILLTIIGTNIVLSGDNALAVAATCQDLTPRLRFWMVLRSTAVATFAQLVLAGAITKVLAVPSMGLVAAGFLAYVAVKMMLSGKGTGRARPSGVGKPAAQGHRHGGLWTVFLRMTGADLAMSGDNAVAIAAVAQHRLDLIALGLAACLPIMVFGSVAIARLLTRFPVLLILVAGRLGWIAGGLAVSDALVANRLAGRFPAAALALPPVAAASLVVAGAFLVGIRPLRRSPIRRGPKVVDPGD